MLMKKNSHTHSLLQTWYMVAKSPPCHTQRHCNVISTFQSLTKRARYHFRSLEGFTKQWCKDYLLGLREYHRNRTGAIEQSIRVGDIVVLKEEGSARCWWKLAKVTEPLRSRDNAMRSAKIQVLNTDAQWKPTVLRRATSHTSHTTGSEPFLETLKTLTIWDRCYSRSFCVPVLSLVLS